MRSEFSLAAHSLLTHAIAYNLEDVDYLGIVAISVARKNDKNPYGKLEMFFPDEWVKNIKGDEQFVDTYFLVKIDRVAVDEWSEKCRALKLSRDTDPQNSPECSNQIHTSSEDTTPVTEGHSFTALVDP